jgi:hypothetical protein
MRDRLSWRTSSREEEKMNVPIITSNELSQQEKNQIKNCDLRVDLRDDCVVYVEQTVKCLYEMDDTSDHRKSPIPNEETHVEVRLL